MSAHVATITEDVPPLRLISAKGAQPTKKRQKYRTGRSRKSILPIWTNSFPSRTDTLSIALENSCERRKSGRATIAQKRVKDCWFPSSSPLSGTRRFTRSPSGNSAKSTCCCRTFRIEQRIPEEHTNRRSLASNTPRSTAAEGLEAPVGAFPQELLSYDAQHILRLASSKGRPFGIAIPIVYLQEDNREAVDRDAFHPR